MRYDVYKLSPPFIKSATVVCTVCGAAVLGPLCLAKLQQEGGGDANWFFGWFDFTIPRNGLFSGPYLILAAAFLSSLALLLTNLAFELAEDIIMAHRSSGGGTFFYYAIALCWLGSIATLIFGVTLSVQAVGNFLF